MRIIRIFSDVIIVLSVFLMPWWIVVALSLVAIFYFNGYYEILALGLLMDSLYNTSTYFWGFGWTISAVVIFLVSFSLKKRLKFY